jgi:serine/threonine-protein kinase
MAPERASGGPVTAAADIYALAVIAFEMLTARRPFTGDSPREVLHNHIHAPPPGPCALNPTLPSHVEAALLQGLAKRPEERYGSAGEFVRALGELAG